MKQALGLMMIMVFCLEVVVWGNVAPHTNNFVKFTPIPNSILAQPIDIRIALPGELPDTVKAKLIVAPKHVAAMQIKLQVPPLNNSALDVHKIMVPKSSALPAGGTVIAGICLSLTVLSSVWLMRRSPTQKWLPLSIILIGLSCATYSVLWANIAPPPKLPPVTIEKGNELVPKPIHVKPLGEDQMIFEVGPDKLERNVLVLAVSPETKNYELKGTAEPSAKMWAEPIKPFSNPEIFPTPR